MNLVLYDGQCGLCDRTVQWLLRIDRQRVLTFAPLQGETSGKLHLQYTPDETFNTIVFISSFGTSQQEIYYKSDAVLEILKNVGGLWRLCASLRVIPKGFRDTLYDWIAYNRYGWFGRYEQCKIPSPEVRDRFLP